MEQLTMDNGIEELFNDEFVVDKVTKDFPNKKQRRWCMHKWHFQESHNSSTQKLEVTTSLDNTITSPRFPST